MQTASTPVVGESDLDQRPAALPPWPTVACFACDEGALFFVFGLQQGGHDHAKVGVVDEAIGEHEVDADDGGQHVDLTDENEGQRQQAGQTDGCHWSPVWAFLLERDCFKTQKRAKTLFIMLLGLISFILE